MNKQEQRIIQAARKVLDNWLYGEINADVSGDFNELESAFKDYENPSSMDFDWQSFRAEAAKDILCAMIPRYEGSIGNEVVEYAIFITDKLISNLKKRRKNEGKRIDDWRLCYFQGLPK